MGNQFYMHVYRNVSCWISVSVGNDYFVNTHDDSQYRGNRKRSDGDNGIFSFVSLRTFRACVEATIHAFRLLVCLKVTLINLFM